MVVVVAALIIQHTNSLSNLFTSADMTFWLMVSKHLASNSGQFALLKFHFGILKPASHRIRLRLRYGLRLR